MKRIISTLILIITLVLASFIVTAQTTQTGYVKTKGRMNSKGQLIPGTRLGGATITLTSGNSTVSGPDGNFSITIPDKKFYLQKVQKQGYDLVDQDILKKQYVYSANPLVITMETPEKQLEDQLKSERKLRRDLQKRLQQREHEVDSLLEQGKISEVEHLKALQNIYAEQTINEKLISEMAKRYSEIDYDLLDEFYRQVTFLIESGDLVKADSLLQTRGNLIQQVEEQKRKAAAIQKEEEQLQKAKEVLAADNEELARRCYSYYEKFLAQYQVDSAIYYIELLAGLDTTNVAWQLAAFPILDSMALYDKAIFYLQRAERHFVANNGEDSIMEGRIIGNIGQMYYKKREFISALDYYQKSLSFLLGSNIKDDSGQSACQDTSNWWVSACFYWMGMVYKEMAEYALAVDYYQKAMERCQSYGEDSLYYKALYYNYIGNVFAEVAQYVQALDYYQKALDIYLVVSGEASSEVASSYNKMGNVYYYMQEYSAALNCYTKYLHIYEDNTLENSYSSIGLAYMNLGNVYVRLGEYGLGKEYLNKALDILQSCYGEYDPDIALLYNNIGGLYREQSESDLAMAYFSKSLKIRKVVYGESHPRIAESYHNIGTVYFDTHGFENSIEYEKKALKIWKSFYGISHPNVSQCYYFILNSYYYLNRMDLAVAFFNNELANLTTTDNNSSDTAIIYQFLGNAYSYQGDYSKAIDYYQKVLTINKTLYGENSPEVATSYNTIGVFYYKLQNYPKALEYYEKVLVIRKSLYGENHVDVADSYNRIGVAYSFLKKYTEALDNYEKALVIRKSLLGENHPDTKQVYDNIKSVQDMIILLDAVAAKQYVFTATTVDGETPAKEQGLSGEYVVLEYGDWSIDSTSSLYDVNEELRGKPKTILIMKDDVISQHSFENTIGVMLKLKQVGKKEKERIKELYHHWRKKHKK